MGTLRLGNDVVVPSVIAKELVNKQKFGASIDNFLGNIDSEGVYGAPAEGFDFVADGIKSVEKEAFYYAFICKPIKTALFPALTTISSTRACSSMFSNCSNLLTASFPALTTISGSSACSYMFSRCSNLTTISFPALTTISGDSACFYMFSNCSSLTSASFPALTTVERITCMPATMFTSCNKLTEIHFRADAQTIIEGQSGYASKFGAINATIYFDL